MVLVVILFLFAWFKRVLEGEASRLFKKYALDVEKLFEFLEATQDKQLKVLEKSYGTDYKQKILGRICDSLKKHGVIHCLRHGIKDRGVTLKLVYNKPPTTMNQLMNELYQKNIFTVSRQVYYSDKHI